MQSTKYNLLEYLTLKLSPDIYKVLCKKYLRIYNHFIQKVVSRFYLVDKHQLEHIE